MRASRTLLTISTGLACAALFAQDGLNDPTFNPIDRGWGQGDGADLTVRGVLVQPDEKILLWGDLSTYNYRASNRLARALPDGNVDTTFESPGTNGDVLAIALQPDGKIIVGGDFTYVGSAPKLRIMRANADGTHDQSFVTVGSGVNGRVNAVALQDDGKVIIAGGFTQFNTAVRNGIARLNTAGAVDGSFNPGDGADGEILATVVQPDGNILIAGDFLHYAGVPRAGIARLTATGALDATFDPGAGASGVVRAMHLQNDGSIYIVGAFSMFNGEPRGGVARLNADGGLDDSFDPAGGGNDIVHGISVQPDGGVLLCGAFTSFGGSAASRVVRLGTDGALDPTFAPQAGADSTVFGVAALSDGRIIVAGDLLHYDDVIQKRVVRLNSDGTLDASFNPNTGAEHFIHAIVVLPDGRSIIGGSFTRYNGVPCNHIARLEVDGTLDPTFQVGSAANSWVNSLAVADDGKILVGGSFDTFNGYARRSLVRLWPDGSVDEGFAPPSFSAGNAAFSIIPLPEGRMLVAGPYYNGAASDFRAIWKFNNDGSIASDFTCEVSDLVNAIALQSNGKILVGKYTAPRLLRLHSDGSIDMSFDPGSGPNFAVQAIAVQPDDKAVVAGTFLAFNGENTGSIVRVMSDGALDPDFDTGGTGGTYGHSYSLLLQPDGQILAGGNFATVGGQSRRGIVRLMANGSIDPSFDPGFGAGRRNFDEVLGLGMQPDGRIIAVGSFLSYDDAGRNRIARITNDINTAVEATDLRVTHTAMPNPTEGHFTLTGPLSHDAIITITDAGGRIVRHLASNVISKAGMTIDLSGEPAGAYTVQVDDAQGTSAVSVVILTGQ